MTDFRQNTIDIVQIKNTKPQREHGDLSELKDSIDRFGLMQPLVITPSGSLIAGRRRFQALMDMGIKSAPVSIINLPDDPNDISRIEAAIDENRVRKNLTPAEEVLVLKMLDEAKRRICGGKEQGQRTDLTFSSDEKVGWGIEDTANSAGISLGKASQDLKLAEEVREHMEECPDLLKAETKKELENKIARIHYSERREQARETPPPTGKYRCIVIDPPWPIVKIERDCRPNQTKALDYPTMTIEEIQALDIANLSYDDCHLYLWVTQKYLPAGLEIVKTWGFKYQCIMTWVKPTGITPFSWMYNTEHVIFARRGDLPLEKQGLKLSFDAPVSGHSIKPDVFYERVCEASPGPRIDMFARADHHGFEAWGNEVGNVELAAR